MLRKLLCVAPSLFLLVSAVGALAVPPGSPAPYTAPNYVNSRAPDASDTSGYSAGSYWQLNGSLWTANTLANGRAIWQTLWQNQGLWLDRVTGPTTGSLGMGAYGVLRMRQAYTGNLFLVQRASDSTTLDIGQVQDFQGRWVADWHAVDTFCANTNCSVKTIHDQSGNGNDLTQTTFANMPQITNNSVYGIRTISWPAITNATFQAWVGSSMQEPFLQHSFVLFGRGYSQTEQGNYLDVGGSGGVQFFPATNTFPTVSRNGNNVRASVPQPTDMTFLGYANSTGSPVTTLYTGTGNQTLSTATAGGSFTNSTLTGVTLGSNAAISSPTHIEFVGAIIYPSTLSTANFNTLYETTIRVLQWQPQAIDQLLVIGTSIDAGRITVSGQPWSTRVQAMLPRPLKSITAGWPSQTCQSQMANDAAFSSEFVAGVKNIAIVDCGTNDLAAAAGPTAVYGYIQTIVGSLKAAGFQVFVGTVLPRNGTFSGGETGAQFEADRQALRTLILNGAQAGGYQVLDFGNDPLMGQLSNITNTAYYNVDLIHPTDLGQDAMANIAYPTLSGIFK